MNLNVDSKSDYARNIFKIFLRNGGQVAATKL